MSLTHSTRFTIANYEDQHLSTKNKFKPIYSKKYKLREKTNLEPLIPMGDQEINKQFIQKCTGALSFSSLIDTYQTVKETPKSISGVKKKKKTNEKKKDVSALHLTPRVLRLIIFSTGITDFANYSLRKYPLYDLIRRSIRNVPGPLQFKLEDHFVHRDHICISCTDVNFSPRV